MDVTIIIVNWNTEKYLRDCLKSLYFQTAGVDFEVIVIDNASSDNSTDMVNNEFPGVVLIKNSENKGFAAANNQGIAITKGRYILLINSDTLIQDNAIEKVVKFSDSYDKAAVVACKILNPDKSLQPNCFMFPSILNLFLYSPKTDSLVEKECLGGTGETVEKWMLLLAVSCLLGARQSTKLG
jgi:GT2 family glycosyltransferase